MSTKDGSYASVNGLEMYYEIHGEGEPLILLLVTPFLAPPLPEKQWR
jgi:hypothetical protein